MGCELGKLTKSAGGGSGPPGQEAACKPAAGPPQQSDPRLPLTAKQKYSMTASWKGISREMEQTGVYMFIKRLDTEPRASSRLCSCHFVDGKKENGPTIFPWNEKSSFHFKSPEKRLFEEHEELLGLFEKLKELRTKEEQAQSLELQEHATKVMKTLDEGIKELDNLDNFFLFLTNIGQSHRKIPGFNPDYFWKIEKPFLEAVKTTLGDRYTENVETIYKITIKLIIETLVKGYTGS